MHTNLNEIELKKFPVLKTDRLELVEIKKCHLRDILDLFGNENVTRFYNIFPFKNEENAQKFIELYHIRFKNGMGYRWGISLKGKRI